MTYRFSFKVGDMSGRTTYFLPVIFSSITLNSFIKVSNLLSYTIATYSFKKMSNHDKIEILFFG